MKRKAWNKIETLSKICTICHLSYSRKTNSIEQWNISIYCSIKCKAKAQEILQKGTKHTPETRLKMRESARKGKDNHFWRGGINNKEAWVRRTVEYKLWRETVFKRDNFTCVWCGTKKSPFNADHIKPFRFFPELRFAIDNGRTLCIPCHKKTDTYGYKIRKIYG